MIIPAGLKAREHLSFSAARPVPAFGAGLPELTTFVNAHGYSSFIATGGADAVFAGSSVSPFLKSI
jgi:hypothetical protein